MYTRPDKRGALNPKSKLDADKVRAIRRSSASCAALARALGVSRAAVSHVRSGRTWAWLDADLDAAS